MKAISDEIIEKSWSEISELFQHGASEKFEEVVESLHEAEPVLAEFLSEAFGTVAPEAADLGFFAVLVIWRSFRGNASPVSSEEMRESFQAAQAWGKGLGGGDHVFLEKKLRDFQAYSQPHLMRYVVEAVLDCHEDGLDLAPEDEERLLVCLKAVVDAFSSVV